MFSGGRESVHWEKMGLNLTISKDHTTVRPKNHQVNIKLFCIRRFVHSHPARVMVLNWIMATAWNMSKCGVLSGPYSVQENTYQEKTLFGYFSRCGRVLAHYLFPFAWEMTGSKYSWEKQWFYGLLVMDFIYILAPWLDFTGWKTSKCGVILACILLHSDLIQRDNVGKYGPGKTPYLDTFHAVLD